jgi:hypoxanthine phosphoribosyltransferase
MPETLIAREALAQRVAELAAAIERDSTGPEPPHCVAVLKGAFVFLADLMRGFEGPVTCDFLGVSSYGGGTSSSGEVRVTQDLSQGIAGRDVVLVEDIVDSGRTLAYLQHLLLAREPRSLRTVCLLDKPGRRQVDVRVDYVGFEIADRFVVGYGLDLDERYRNLPYIATIDSAPWPEPVRAHA